MPTKKNSYKNDSSNKIGLLAIISKLAEISARSDVFKFSPVSKQQWDHSSLYLAPLKPSKSNFLLNWFHNYWCIKRYQDLLELYKKHGFKDEAEWVTFSEQKIFV